MNTIEKEWNAAPTVYRTIVDRIPVPVHGQMSQGGRILHDWRIRRRARAIIDESFPVRSPERAMDPTTTKVIADCSTGSLEVRFLLYNGARVTAFREGNLLFYVVELLGHKGWTRSGWLSYGMIADYIHNRQHIPTHI